MRGLAALLSFTTGLANFWQFITLLQQRPLLLAYGADQALTTTLFASVIWSCVFTGFGILTWRKWLPARKLLPMSFLCYTLYNVLWFNPTRPFVIWYIFLTIFTLTTLNSDALKRGVRQVIASFGQAVVL